VNVFYWVDRECGYALSGEIDRKSLARVADAVYHQLENE
jgi:anti-sigma factor RsiW